MKRSRQTAFEGDLEAVEDSTSSKRVKTSADEPDNLVVQSADGNSPLVLSEMPVDVLFCIFRELSLVDLFSVQLVCQKWSSLVWESVENLHLTPEVTRFDTAPQHLTHVRKLKFNDESNSLLPADARIFISRVPQFTSIRALKLSTNVLDDTILQQICLNLLELQHLNVSDCSRLTALAFNEIHILHKLSYLNISSCHYIDSTVLQHVEKLQQLTRLIMDDTPAIALEPLVDCWCKMPRLQTATVYFPVIEELFNGFAMRTLATASRYLDTLVDGFSENPAATSRAAVLTLLPKMFLRLPALGDKMNVLHFVLWQYVENLESDAPAISDDEDADLALLFREMIARFKANVNLPTAKGVRLLQLAMRIKALKTVQVLLDAGADFAAEDASVPCPTSLYSACRFGVVDFISSLLQNPHIRARHINPPSSRACVPLLAVSRLVEPNSSISATSIAQLLISAGANVNVSRRDTGATPLTAAVDGIEPCDDQTALVELLIRSGADVNAVQYDGDSPLLLAVSVGAIQLTQMLIDAGANVRTRNAAGQSALHHAAEMGSVPLLKLLLSDKSINVNSELSFRGLTAFTSAAFKGRLAACKYLLSVGADPSLSTKGGETPLWLSCYYGHFEVVKLVIQHHIQAGELQARLNQARTMDGATPLFAACQQGHEEIVSYLLSFEGIDYNAKRRDAVSPLLVATQHRLCGIVGALLAMPNIEVNAVSNCSISTLMAAVTSSDAKVIEMLLKAGAQPNMPDSQYNSPILMAVHNQSIECVKALLKHAQVPVAVDLANRQGTTPLFRAAELDFEEAIELLLEHGADPNITNLEGITPLHAAAWLGSCNAIKSLLARSTTNLMPVTLADETPLWFAAFGDHSRALALILDEIEQRFGEAIMHREMNGSRRTDGSSPLFVACQHRKLNAIVELLRRGAAIDVPSCRDYSTPLWVACASGHFDVVKVLLEYSSTSDNNKIDIDRQRLDGATSLYVAAQEGHLDVVNLLLSHGASPDILRKDYLSPLDVAIQNNRREVALRLAQVTSPEILNFQSADGSTVVWQAATAGSADLLAELLKRGADPNICRSDGNSPLGIATHNGKLACVKTLVEFGANVDSRSKVGESIIWIAAQAGRTDILEYILPLCKETDVNSAATDGSTPLYVAAQHDEPAVAKFLLQNGADPLICNADGGSPLYTAVFMGAEEVARLIVNFFVEDPKTDPSYIQKLINLGHLDGSTPLYVACEKNFVSLVRFLLDHGANPNAGRKDGSTPLYITCTVGSTEIAQLLLDHGADPDRCNLHRFSPTFACVQFGKSVELLQLLLQHADMTIASDRGDTPLSAAASLGRDDMLLVLLERLKTIPDYQWHLNRCHAGTGDSPLAMAAYEGHDRCVELLVEFGADINLGGIDGSTPLLKACLSGKASVVELLVRKCGERLLLRAHRGDGVTCLVAAIRSESIRCVRPILSLLVQRSPDVIDEEEFDGRRPLHRAASIGRPDILRALIEAGANVNATSGAGESPLFTAIEARSTECVKLLIGAGADRTMRYKGKLPHQFALSKALDEIATLLKCD